MRKVFTYLFLTAVVCLSVGCSKTADNANQATANSNQTDAAVKTENTPLPTFTNADEALAAGKKLLDEIETEKAIEAFQQAIKLNPDLAEAHFNLGIAYSLIEKDEEETVKNQVETAPTPTPKKGKKESAERTKESEKAFDNAVKAYKKILDQNPKDDVSQFNLGRAYNKLNEDEDAKDALREAVKLKPEDAEYQIEYGKILIKLAQYDEAVAAIKKAVSLDESNLEAQDLLEKAQAGRERVGFGNKPKPSPQPGQPKSKESPTPPATNSKPAEAATPAKKNANQ